VRDPGARRGAGLLALLAEAVAGAELAFGLATHAAALVIQRDVAPAEQLQRALEVARELAAQGEIDDAPARQPGDDLPLAPSLDHPVAGVMKAAPVFAHVLERGPGAEQVQDPLLQHGQVLLGLVATDGVGEPEIRVPEAPVDRP
jgi:hypothetical protein